MKATYPLLKPLKLHRHHENPAQSRCRTDRTPVSILCVTGSYTSVNCTLTLLKSAIRKNQQVGDDGYARTGAEDSRFSDHFGSLQAIVTSTGQSDSRLFETKLRDERYLPFENSGVISEWQLELPADVRQFDYDTISDVILHIRYTAREGGGLLRNGAVANLKTSIEEAQAAGSVRLFSVRHEFPSEWAKFQGQTPDTNRFELALNLRKEHYPFWSQGRLESVARVDLLARSTKVPVPGSLDVFDKSDPSDATILATLANDAALDNLLVGKLTEISLPPSPVDEMKFFLEDRELGDLWVAVTWGK